MEWSGTKADAMYALAVQLLADGVPFHGVGFEGHLIVNEFYQTFTTNWARFDALGIEFAITELDIRFLLPSTDTLLAEQASNYAYVVNSCLAFASCIGITTWDTRYDFYSLLGLLVKLTSTSFLPLTVTTTAGERDMVPVSFLLVPIPLPN